MNSFVQRHQDDVTGVLAGFDRLRFRGTLRSIAYCQGLNRFLNIRGIRYKDFGEFALDVSDRLKRHAEQIARQAGRPFQYVGSSAHSKEAIAREIAEREGVEEGLVCVLRCVEPCMGFSIRRDAEGRFRFVCQQRKGLHLYFYYLDRDMGLMHVRLATWLPLGIQVCVNGRSYLARRMAKAGIGYEQRDNCFVRIDDLARAQAMLQELEHRRWERVLGALARRVNPLAAELGLRPYYWSLQESEYATDVMFRDAATLARLYPALADHAIKQFGCQDALRFLGRRTNRRFSGEVSTSWLERAEGLRVKHWVEENSIKMYDKQGSVLRIETTINNVRRFRVRRMTVWKGVRRMRWMPMRHAVADLDRRVEIHRAANERYLEALAVIHVPGPAYRLLDRVSRRVVKQKRPYRALRPISPEEAKAFQVLLDGRFLLKGFRNRDLRARLGPTRPPTPQDARRLSGKITRLLRLFRAHGLIHKVSGTRYYRVTSHGHRLMSAALTLRETDLVKLTA